MLIELQEDGRLAWNCHTCGIQTAHVAHPDIQFTGEHIIALPLCPCCAKSGRQEQTFLKVHFTPQELTAPNMVHPVTGEPTESHRAAHRHMALVAHMAEHGKAYDPLRRPGQASDDTDPKLRAL